MGADHDLKFATAAQQTARPDPVLDDAEDGGGPSLLAGLLFVAENWKTLMFVPLAAGLVALGLSFLIPPSYVAVARILPPQQGGGAAMLIASQLGSLAGLAGAAAGIKNPGEQFVTLIKSRTIADGIIAKHGLAALYEKEYVDDVRKTFSKRLDASVGTKDGVITIEFEDEDPKRAADVANGVIDEVRQLTKRLALTEASQRRVFFEAQLETVRANLNRAEAELRGSGVSESTLRAEPRAAVEEVARLKAAVTISEVKLATMRGVMTDANPDLKQAQQELAALRSQLARAERGSGPTADGTGGEYIARYRDFKYHEMLFELMAKQFELAKLDEARDGGTVQIVDQAVPPDRKTKPKKALIAIAATLVVFVLTVVAIFVRDSVRREIAERATAEQLVRLQRLWPRRRRPAA